MGGGLIGGRPMIAITIWQGQPAGTKHSSVSGRERHSTPVTNFDQTITVKQWHTLRVTHQGCRVNIFYDDKQVFDLCDKTFHAG